MPHETSNYWFGCKRPRNECAASAPFAPELFYLHRPASWTASAPRLIGNGRRNWQGTSNTLLSIPTPSTYATEIPTLPRELRPVWTLPWLWSKRIWDRRSPSTLRGRWCCTCAGPEGNRSTAPRFLYKPPTASKSKRFVRG